MAQRRMFSLKVVDTDNFLDMPQTTQNLYFHLAMRADDDGFVSSPKKIMKMVNSPDDDFKILATKQFILPFKSGVIVIKHWKENNYIQADRYHKTIYCKEMALLSEDENGVYEMDTECIQNVSPGKVRLGKVRKGKDTNTGETKVSQEGAKIIEKFKSINPSLQYGNTTQRKACDELIGKFGLEEALRMVDMALSAQLSDRYCPRATTPHLFWQKLGDFMVYFKGKSNFNNVVSV